MINKIQVYGIVLIIFIVMLIAIIYGGKVIIKLNDKIDSLETTVIQSDSTNKVILLSNEMFNRVLENKLDSIEKHTKIKPKYITNVTEIHNHYQSNDTTIYVAPELSSNLFDISYGNKCWGFTGSFNTVNKKVKISDKWAENDITIYGYFQRDRLWGVKWFPKWGTRRDFLGSYSDCGIKTEVTEYKLKKK